MEANFTRFFLVGRAGDGIARAAEPSRACVALDLPHVPGSLVRALRVFADAGLDLRTLVSRPSLEAPFTYRFYCDLAPVATAALASALAAIGGASRVLGHY